MLTLIISLLSLSVSLLVAYSSNFKKSRPGVLIGSQITLYPAPFNGRDGIVWGATGIYIPVTFFNWSPNGGSIIECRIIISRVDNPNKIFDIGWAEFAEMLQDERRMGNAGLAQPIPLPPRSSLTKTILFIWFPSDDRLDISPGQYNLSFLTWVKSSVEPKIRESFEFSITDQLSDDFNFYLENKKAMTIEVSIRETNRLNSILTLEQLNNAYKFQ